MAQVSNVQLGEGAPAVKPSENMTNKNTKTTSVVDVLGRTISLKRVTALDTYRLMKLLGPQTAGNGSVVQLALMACSVTAIDGDTVPPPGTEREIEAILQRLDFEGITAVTKAMEELGSISSEAVEAAKNS